MTATDFSAGQGHSVTDGTDAIVAFALAGPTPDRRLPRPQRRPSLMNQTMSKGSPVYLITESTGNSGRGVVDLLTS